MKRFICFSALITLISLRLVGQVPSTEIPLSAPEPGPADRSQKNPAVATDGEVFLVAWTNDYGARPEGYAARVSRSGQLLDEISFPVAIKPEMGFRPPRVAWTGRVFLVMYGPVVKRISRQGEILDEALLPPGELESLACNLSRCLAVYERLAGESRMLRGTLLDADGEVIVEDIEIASFRGVVPLAASASNGANFLVAWHVFDPDSPTERQALYARAVTSSGGVGPSRRIAASQFALGYHDAASDGSGYLLAWTSGELPSRVEAMRFNSSGNPSGDVVAVHGARNLGHEVRLARWSARYVLLLMNQDRSMLEAFRVGTGGSKTEPDPIATWPIQDDGTFDVAASSDKALVVWDAAPIRTDPDVHGALLDAGNAAATQTLVVSRTARPQYAPAVAAGGDSTLAVWEEHFPGKASRILGTFLREGSAEPALGITPEFDQAHNPAIAFDGSKFLVTWTEGTKPTYLITPRQVMARTLSASGDALGDPVVVAERSCFNSKVAASGAGFLVTWVECSSRQLHGALLAADGTVLSRFPISPTATAVLAGGIAWGGDSYLVTWIEARPFGFRIDPPGLNHVVVAARLNRDGVLLNTMELSHDVFSAPPHVTWDGTRFLVTWQRGDVVEAARIGTDGSAEAPRRFSGRGAGPAVAWDGMAFIGVGAWNDNFPFGDTDLRIARVTHAQLDSGEGAPAVRLIATIDDEFAPAVVAIAPGKVAIAYQRAAHEREYGSANRVFVRLVAFPKRARAIRR